MFALVMQGEMICAEFIQRLFPGKKVRPITFPNDIQITPEKTIVTGVLSKSVRLDVLFEGERQALQRSQTELCYFHLHERSVQHGRSGLSISDD